MTLDPEIVRKGFMLLSPTGQLLIVTYATRISMSFAFVDEATKRAAEAEGWSAVEPSVPSYTYMFCFASLDGQETNSASFGDGSQMVGWELIASVSEESTDEPAP